MPSQTSPLDDLDPRRIAILLAAMEVFARYGFKRTSMEDIAQAAGLSRTALYLHYRNKQDIYRSLVQWYFTQTERRVKDALKPGLAPEVALGRAFGAKLGPEMKALYDSPHGEELLDANISTAADVAMLGEAVIASHLRDWLAGEAAAGRIALPGGGAEDTAAMMVRALNGQKTRGLSFEETREGLATLAQLLGRGLRP
ncbi:MAG: TetR/AcrR family transcriptional regulator [Pararhodobacter sp.]